MKISNGIQIVFLSVLITHSLTIDQIARNVEDWSRLLGEQIQEIFESATKHNEIVEMYKSYAQSEIFDPRIELKKIKHLVENYLKVRSKAAWDAKVSLESRTVSNISELEVNDPMSMNFIRFMSAKNGSDAAQVFAHDHTGTVTEVNSTREVNLTMNANFYGIPTSSAFSSIHIPTPVYNRNPNILLKIDWSDIDQVYRANRQQTKDLSFQMFCSESGFMRYFPSAKWMWDNENDGLDLFDCRSTTWYINGATSSKNVVIMLDMSGSMLGQRFEIAKQTVEAILETLSENDFFNIILFSKSVQFIDKCSNETLLQATLRNKKIVRAGINRFSSEGKAEYEKGLTKAFETLLKMHNDSGKRERFGCNDVIMLITDGAPAYFKEIFKLYNKNKHVRFFSFLIGEEATDFEQVRWMACSNKGFLLHINNLADVQEKVQQYIKAMSKAIGRYASTISQKNAAWSGLYKERLLTTKILPARKKTRAKHLDAKTEMYMTTVSYPVALNGTFMGVSAVTVAITELMQLAHPSNLGSRSYTFMMDNNGYVLFHPQLRQTDAFGQSKPSFNNVDILELEVPQNQQLVWLKISDSGKPSTACKTDIFDAECIRVLRWQMKKAMIQCNNEEVYALDVLFATEEMDRVYRQTNIYYSECIKDTLFTVGMAVAKGDLKRIKPIRNIDYGNVELSWFDDYKWKMHPDWRYCFLNDSDINLSTEEAFRIYAQQMQDEKKLPNLCEPRRSLVDKFLFDMKVTNGLGSLWRSNQNFAKKKDIHIIFFSTPSGLIKYWDELPKGLVKTDPNWMEHTTQSPKSSISSPQKPTYSHFIVDLNRRSSEDRYYRRSVRMKNRIVIEANTQTNLWRKTESISAYGNPENISLLLTATKALYIDDALIGVTGIEITLDFFANMLKKIGCGPQERSFWCFLLDEHGYVVYSSVDTTNYKSLFSTDSKERKRNPIGLWFGNINRITQKTMSLLVRNNYYTETMYVDYQAICSEINLSTPTAGALKPFLSLLKTFLWIIARIWVFLKEFAFVQVIRSLFSPVKAYTTLFNEANQGFSCDKDATFYLANWGEEGWMGQKLPSRAALISDKTAERPCENQPSKCGVKLYANWVTGTNLLLVAISQVDKAGSICYDENLCLFKQDEISFGFRVRNVSDAQQGPSMEPSDPEDNANRFCRHVRSKQRKASSRCFRLDDDKSEFSCSRATKMSEVISGFVFSIVVICCLVL